MSYEAIEVDLYNNHDTNHINQKSIPDNTITVNIETSSTLSEFHYSFRTNLEIDNYMPTALITWTQKYNSLTGMQDDKEEA